jgi:hypothetical protein
MTILKELLALSLELGQRRAQETHIMKKIPPKTNKAVALPLRVGLGASMRTTYASMPSTR